MSASTFVTLRRKNAVSKELEHTSVKHICFVSKANAFACGIRVAMSNAKRSSQFEVGKISSLRTVCLCFLQQHLTLDRAQKVYLSTGH
jgi:hypothetical protein